jgi:predicted dehydrogenase
MIAHHLRHQKAVSDIKTLIESGKIGKLLNASLQWGFEMNLDAPNAIWKLNPEFGGKGTFSDNGIHVVDLAIHFFGVPKSISGNTLKVRTKDTFDNETAFLVYENDLCVQLQSSQSMKYPGNHILIYGDKGSIEAFYAIGEKSIKQVVVKSMETQETIDYPTTNLYGNEVENFCRKLIDSSYQNVGTTLNEGLSALNIIDTIRKSANNNSTINFTL